MTPLEKLQSLGFPAQEIADGRRPGSFVYRIRTARGWTYERFQTEDDVTIWAAEHKPG